MAVKTLMFALSVKGPDNRFHLKRHFSQSELRLAPDAELGQVHDAIMAVAPEYRNVSTSVVTADYRTDASAEIQLHALPSRSEKRALMCGTAAIMAITGLSYDALLSQWGVAVAGPGGLTIRETGSILETYGYRTHQVQFFDGIWMAPMSVGKFLDSRHETDFNTYLVQLRDHVILSSRAGVIDNHSRTIQKPRESRWRRHKLLNVWAVARLQAPTDNS